MTLQELIKLIYNSTIQELKEFRKQGVDFTLTDPHDQNNILIAYCGYGYDEKYTQTEIVNFLIECGNNVNSQRNGRGSNLSALHLAVAENFTEIVRCLIDNGANVEPRDDDGNTPLIEVVFDYGGEKEKLEIIKCLLDNGASVDTKNDHGVSAREMIEDTGKEIDEGHSDQEVDLRFLIKKDANKT